MVGQRQDRLADKLVREANTLAIGPSIEVDSSSGTKKKCGRGHNRNFSLDMNVQRHGKTPITID